MNCALGKWGTGEEMTDIFSNHIGGSSELLVLADIKPGFVPIRSPITYASRLRRHLKLVDALNPMTKRAPAPRSRCRRSTFACESATGPARQPSIRAISPTPMST